MGMKLQGIVSEIPAKPVAKMANTPAMPSNDNVIDIPDFLKRRQIQLKHEYAQRQAELYEEVNKPSKSLRLKTVLKKFFLLFFE